MNNNLSEAWGTRDFHAEILLQCEVLSLKLTMTTRKGAIAPKDCLALQSRCRNQQESENTSNPNRVRLRDNWSFELEAHQSE